MVYRLPLLGEVMQGRVYSFRDTRLVSRGKSRVDGKELAGYVVVALDQMSKVATGEVESFSNWSHGLERPTPRPPAFLHPPDLPCSGKTSDPTRDNGRPRPVSVAHGYYLKSERFPRGGSCFPSSGQLRDGIGRGPLGSCWGAAAELRHHQRKRGHYDDIATYSNTSRYLKLLSADSPISVVQPD